MIASDFGYPLLLQAAPINHLGVLAVQASVTSSSGDYAFLMGKHHVHHKKLKNRFSNSSEWVDIHGTKETESLLRGISNIEKHYLYDVNGTGTDAFALRLYNPASRLWSLYWADSVYGTLDSPVIGSFKGNLGVFFGNDLFNGKEIIVQFQYDRKDPENPVWGQAFSQDKGITWEWNWFMFYRKIR